MLTPHKIKHDTLITSHDQLINSLAVGARPEAEWGIGAEMEMLVVDAKTGEAAKFSRIETLLAA
ncbi:MAG: gamma-glutamylcysteine synthetase, partial [Candidatus Marinimicrobia bacterium]|nr:gamma-glutamylcysteine synthetase [Candidatus Neomarinimicrobiota bacterium]